MNELRIPCPCRFCNRVTIGASKTAPLNYDEVCARCKEPREPWTVLVPGLERGRVTPDVERLWRSTRPRPHLRRPGAGITAVLLALAEAGALHGSAIARITSRRQPAVSVWLRRLALYGFVEIDFVIQGRGGGRAAEYWALTGRGRELAAALAAELVGA